MIDREKLSSKWIDSVSKNNKDADKILVEKVIRSLLLLEGLVLAQLSFIFKGGTSLMLHFNSAKRLSIDIDIVTIESAENLEKILEAVANDQGFNRVELQERRKRINIEKMHFKFFYTPIHKTAKDEEFILLDILFEKSNYTQIVQLPITSAFLPQKGEEVLVKVPSIEDLLGDKLTAFAPNTTGIPYFKGNDSMSMEIIKQLYDIGNLFDVGSDLQIVRKTFDAFAETELNYREQTDKKREDVLEDIFQTSLCISSRGILGKGNFEELQQGIKRIAGFIFSETYHIEKAIVSAAKAAYLSTLLKTEVGDIEKFESPMQIRDFSIENPEYNKLNKLKKSNPEAFFYWYKTLQIRMSSN